MWDVHWSAFAIFRACRTQWRITVLPSALLYGGLDYPGVEVVIRHTAPRSADRRAIFADILIMEAEALVVLNEGEG